MKIDLGPVQPDALPSRRGVFYTRMTRWGPVVQAWPKKGKRQVTRQEYWWREQFKIAGWLASNAVSLDWQTAEFLARPLVNPPRDLLTQAAYGNLYEVTEPDGTVWPVTSKAAPELVPPPPPGEPYNMWEWPLWDRAATAGVSANASACKGNYFRVSQGFTIRGVRARFTPVVGALYRAHVWRISPAGVIQAELGVDDRTATTAVPQVIEWSIEVPMTPGNTYMVSILRVGSANTFPLNLLVDTPAAWLLPINVWGTGVLAQANPVIGQTFTLNPTGAYALGVLT